MERITVEVTWDAEDGTLRALEDSGGDGTLIEAARNAFRDDPSGSSVEVAASYESV